MPKFVVEVTLGWPLACWVMEIDEETLAMSKSCPKERASNPADALTCTLPSALAWTLALANMVSLADPAGCTPMSADPSASLGDADEEMS